MLCWGWPLVEAEHYMWVPFIPNTDKSKSWLIRSLLEIINCISHVFYMLDLKFTLIKGFSLGIVCSDWAGPTCIPFPWPCMTPPCCWEKQHSVLLVEIDNIVVWSGKRTQLWYCGHSNTCPELVFCSIKLIVRFSIWNCQSHQGILPLKSSSLYPHQFVSQFNVVQRLKSRIGQRDLDPVSSPLIKDKKPVHEIPFELRGPNLDQNFKGRMLVEELSPCAKLERLFADCLRYVWRRKTSSGRKVLQFRSDIHDRISSVNQMMLMALICRDKSHRTLIDLACYSLDIDLSLLLSSRPCQANFLSIWVGSRQKEQTSVASPDEPSGLENNQSWDIAPGKPRLPRRRLSIPFLSHWERSNPSSFLPVDGQDSYWSFFSFSFLYWWKTTTFRFTSLQKDAILLNMVTLLKEREWVGMPLCYSEKTSRCF